MKLDPVLLEILVCPACKSSLTVDNDNDELVCTGCSLAYPVRDDIPVMLVDEARPPSTGQPRESVEGANADTPPEGTEEDNRPDAADVDSERTS